MGAENEKTPAAQFLDPVQQVQNVGKFYFLLVFSL